MARDQRTSTLETVSRSVEISAQSTFHSVREVGCQMSGPCLWGLLMFLLSSCAAFWLRDLNLFAMASEPVRQILGYPPPALLVSIALGVYTFSAAVLTLTAMSEQARPTGQWNHLGYRVAFYLFYAFSGSIAPHFLAVLLVGMSLYLLNLVHAWVYALHWSRNPEQLPEGF